MGLTAKDRFSIDKVNGSHVVGIITQGNTWKKIVSLEEEIKIDVSPKHKFAITLGGFGTSRTSGDQEKGFRYLFTLSGLGDAVVTINFDPGLNFPQGTRLVVMHSLGH